MTQGQFKEIRDMAWDWWCKNMLDWAVNTIKDFDNAPKWVKNGVDNSLEPDNLQKLLRLSQSRNFDVNYSKELTEFLEAKRDDNEYQMIDALCDMVVVSINAGIGFHSGENTYIDFYKNRDINENIVRCFISKETINPLLANIELKGYDPYKCLLETIKELNTRTGAWNEQEGKWCKDLGAYSSEEALKEAEKYLSDNCIFPHDLSIVKEDCDFWLIAESEEYDEDEFEYLSIEQVSKELMGYSCKVKKWYKADYENCKIAVCPYCKNDCGYGKYVECQNCGMKFQTIAD